MRIKERLAAIEHALGLGRGKTLFVKWPVDDPEALRLRVERARRGGWRLHVVRFCRRDESVREIDVDEPLEAAGTGDRHAKQDADLPYWLSCAGASS